MKFNLTGLPTRWAICSQCEGNGRAENPAFSNGFTSEEWSEMCADDMDDGSGSTATRYLAGAYDVPCHPCNSSGKVKIPDVGNMTFAQRRTMVGIRRKEREEHEYQLEAAMERRMGA